VVWFAVFSPLGLEFISGFSCLGVEELSLEKEETRESKLFFNVSAIPLSLVKKNNPARIVPPMATLRISFAIYSSPFERLFACLAELSVLSSDIFLTESFRLLTSRIPEPSNSKPCSFANATTVPIKRPIFTILLTETII